MRAHRHWSSINEVTFVAGMRFLFGVYRLLGRWPFRLVLYPVLLWYVLSKPLARRASRDYLGRIAALTPVQTGMTGVLGHFAAFAESILDKMLLWNGLFKLDQVSFHGVAEIDRLISEGRGALLICSHFGNLELGRVLSRRHGNMRLTILVHTRHARAFNQMLAALNPDSGLNLMQVTEMTPHTAMLLGERVARGEFVVIAGDRVPVSSHPQVMTADFLGAPAAFPIGPYIIASVLQCPAYLLFAVRTKGGSEVHFELLRETVRVPRSGREQALRPLVADYAARLQHHCLRAPMQWFNFYDFWHLPAMENNDASR
jgi:predicted LPLAT superfamily acyltransferase